MIRKMHNHIIYTTAFLEEKFFLKKNPEESKILVQILKIFFLWKKFQTIQKFKTIIYSDIINLRYIKLSNFLIFDSIFIIDSDTCENLLLYAQIYKEEIEIEK